ncbi:MAG: CAP domain-containing protein [Bdellovibrionota bacterium]
MVSKFIIGFVGLLSVQAFACQWPDNTPAPADRAREILTACDRINDERRYAGLDDLILDGRLIVVAQGHAQDMSDRNYFSHVSPEGWRVFDRLRAYGMPFWSAGENIAIGESSAWQVMNDWMGSPGHRANILGQSFRRVGMGLWNYRWVQVFSD